MRSADSPWAWVQEFYPLGFRFSFFEGRSPGDVLTTFDVDAATAEPMTFHDAGAAFFDQPNVYRVGEADGWGFAFEEFGGDHDAQLRALSTGGRAVSVFRVESGLTGFRHFRDGASTCSFDPLEPSRRIGPDADRFLAAMRRVALDPDVPVDLDHVSPAVAALDLVTELSGVRLDAAVARGPLLTGQAEPELSWMGDDEPDWPPVVAGVPFPGPGSTPG
ncbi:DUF6461 domain-containing protein [Pseudonocardia lacus]|uniref:DUF6461 domain-containing protein n=1 Tax=Pseudonocardia lacus TaxID=2835865 RepID=UPI001BDCF48C|nr:DUF6461 domain-containing protein [Pseudonocardia lacus]